jgi:hypothetical protein
VSFLSLEKYLYAAQKSSGAALAEVEPALGYFELSRKILTSVGSSFFLGEALADLSQELDTLREGLRPDSSPENLASAAQRFSGLLLAFRERLRQADQERAEDFRKVLAILNEAFANLNTGGDRSDVRLRKLESSLQDATRIDDLRNLKMHLSQTLQFVRKEAEREREERRVAIQALGSQISEVHKSAARFRVGLSGRDEALAEMASSLGQNEAGTSLYLALFVVDSLPALRARHGNEIADGLLDELGRKEIQTLAPNGKIFCWTPHAVLLVWRSSEDRDKVRKLGNQIKTPFQYGASVGTRVATFSIALRSLIMQAGGALDQITVHLDQFVSQGARC